MIRDMEEPREGIRIGTSERSWRLRESFCARGWSDDMRASILVLTRGM